MSLGRFVLRLLLDTGSSRWSSRTRLPRRVRAVEKSERAEPDRKDHQDKTAHFQ